MLTPRILDDTDLHRRQVAEVLMASADYYLPVEGVAPGPEPVDDFFTSVPPGYTREQLVPLGLYEDARMAGVAGLLLNWNAPHKAMIGLLLFPPEARGAGLGAAAVPAIEGLMRRWPDITTLRVGVVTTNPRALAFWERAGFRRTGEVKPRYGTFTGDIVILEKSLEPR